MEALRVRVALAILTVTGGLVIWDSVSANFQVPDSLWGISSAAAIYFFSTTGAKGNDDDD